MEAVKRRETASFQNMESQIEQLARIIIEEPLSNILSNMVTLWDVKEQVIRFSMFMDDKDKIAQEPEFPSPRFQEPLSSTSVVEESKKHECSLENKSEFGKGEPEKENKKFESWKQPKGNDEERRRLMKFKGNFKNVEREQSLFYVKARMSFSSSLTLSNLLFSFKELKLFEFYNIFLKLDFTILVSRVTWGF
ncbi:hypothetical protein M9H77_11703 [Catharanthus roseus]|uniref:Uncharacterized protein n=1 Tax=Catharanthus roseus TaxID=4058 RepID=A0ACC0BFB2_CATRO|nr:hypothetical protein M9H77_11703 [Catharanthus roseus]